MALQAIQGQGKALPAPTSSPSLPAVPTSTPTPVQEPGMAGYTGPTQQQAGQIASTYQSGVPYQQAVSSVMGTPPAPSSQGSPFNSDPGYQAALAAEQMGISQSNSALNNLIQQRIIAYGDPSLANMAGFGLDPQAAAFAKQNYLSGNAQLARVDKQHQNNLKAIINQLAGHGLIFSGDTGYQTGQEDQNYGNNVYDAQQAALADILGYRQNTLQQQQQAHNQTIQALEQAYQNYINNPSAYGNDQGYQGAPGSQAPDVAGNYQYATAAQVANALKRYTVAQKKNLGF